MPNKRELDKLMQRALEMKDIANDFINYCKMYGGGEPGEGEEDLEEIDEEETEVDSKAKEAEEDGEATMNKKPKAMIIMALKKKMGKK